MRSEGVRVILTILLQSPKEAGSKKKIDVAISLVAGSGGLGPLSRQDLQPNRRVGLHVGVKPAPPTPRIPSAKNAKCERYWDADRSRIFPIRLRLQETETDPI